MSADGKTHSFQLRRSATSAVGHELTAHDVKWSWERAFALNSWSARAVRACGIDTPDVVRVAHTYIIQFRLEGPNPRLAPLLASPMVPVYDLEAVRDHCPLGDPWGDEWLRTHTAGFGPFRLDSVAAGEEATLLANDWYWQGPARERVIILRSLNTARARADAVKRGSVDIAEGLPAPDMNAACVGGAVKPATAGGQRDIVLRLDPEFAPFNQPRVRQAMALALPFDEIAQRAFGGAASRPPNAEQSAKGARELLREAGYGAGFRYSLAVPAGNGDLEAVAQIMQLDGMRLGLKVAIDKLDPPIFEREKAARHLPAYLEERFQLTPFLPVDALEPLREVDAIPVATPPSTLAVRANVQGFVRRPDGRPRFSDLRKL